MPISSCILTLCFKLDCKIVDFLEDPLEKGQAIHSSILGFPYGSAGKESAYNVGDLGNPWVGKIPWRRERLPIPVFRSGGFYSP